MRPSHRKPDPFAAKPKIPMNIEDVWAAAGTDDGTVQPPKQNLTSLVPFTRLVHNLNNLMDLSDTVAIDQGTVSLIQRKTPLFKDNNIVRKRIELNLMGYHTQFKVILWIIPIFSDGIMVHHLFAADEENQELLRQHRNPVKSSTYDISQF